MTRRELHFEHWSGGVTASVGGTPQSNDERNQSLSLLSTLLFDVEANEGSASTFVRQLYKALFPFALGPAQPSSQQVRFELEAAIQTDLLALRRRQVPRIRVDAPPLTTAGGGSSASETSGSDDELTFFEARFVDEVGEGIDGLAVVLVASGQRHDGTTDGTGKVRFDGIDASFASLRVSDAEALRTKVEPRWEQLREGPFPTATPQSVFRLTDDLSSIALTSELEHLVVITPELGKLFLELFDKTGRFRHANVDYTISGPMSFEGTTDEQGVLLHEDVLPGEYTLKFTLEFFEGDDAVADEYETPVVVLAGSQGAPQQRMIGAVPRVVMSLLGGLLFETNKNFLVPSALPALAELVQVYHDNPNAKLLVVGHTDTTGDPGYNDPLSVERAEAVAAFLADNVDYWLGRYGSGVPQQKRWGDREDTLMLHSLPDFDPESQEDDLRRFQASRGLTVDGIAGPQTRRQLITEYMAEDGTTLPDSIEVTVHGCGENFPVNSSGTDLDPAPANAEEDILDRRVELFFFDPEFGVAPKPAGTNSKPGSSQYPTWRDSAKREERRVGESKLVSQIHAQLLTQDGGHALGEATVEITLPDRVLTVVASESGIVFVASAPAGDFPCTVTSESGSEGQCHLPSNNLRQGPRQLNVRGIRDEQVDAEAAADEGAEEAFGIDRPGDTASNLP